MLTCDQLSHSLSYSPLTSYNLHERNWRARMLENLSRLSESHTEKYMYVAAVFSCLELVFKVFV
ncbi:hypothetical protein Bca4012_094959 [Brassica carinata]